MDDAEFDDFARCMGMKAVLLLIQTNGVVFPIRNSRTKKSGGRTNITPLTVY